MLTNVSKTTQAAWTPDLMSRKVSNAVFSEQLAVVLLRQGHFPGLGLIIFLRPDEPAEAVSHRHHAPRLAGCERLLHVDNAVRVPSAFLCKLMSYNASPAVICLTSGRASTDMTTGLECS